MFRFVDFVTPDRTFDLATFEKLRFGSSNTYEISIN